MSHIASSTLGKIETISDLILYQPPALSGQLTGAIHASGAVRGRPDSKRSPASFPESTRTYSSTNCLMFPEDLTAWTAARMSRAGAINQVGRRRPNSQPVSASSGGSAIAAVSLHERPPLPHASSLARSVSQQHPVSIRTMDACQRASSSPPEHSGIASQLNPLAAPSPSPGDARSDRASFSSSASPAVSSLPAARTQIRGSGP